MTGLWTLWNGVEMVRTRRFELPPYVLRKNALNKESTIQKKSDN